MTNHEKFRLYTDGLTSPDNYINWTWRYIIAASLQRRVWLPPEHQKCFANMYVILVGKAGLGKGLCITRGNEFLRHWKLKDAITLNPEWKKEFKEQAELVKDADLKNAIDAEMHPNNKQAGMPDPLLIPVASDATTYEALVSAVASSYKRINYPAYDDKLQKEVLRVYGHSSMCFCLPELASLLRKRTDDTVNYMLGLYDCPEDYIYDTKTKGKDRVRRGCLNLLAGTTPDFMQDIFNAKLIDQGFGSRTFFIYANKDRKTSFWIPELTAEQKDIQKDLLEHIRKLTSLYGPVKMDKETMDFLEDWWRDAVNKRANISHKLEGYYARKKVHVMKIALAEHFGESTEMFIPLERFQNAIEISNSEEKNMHLAITLEGTNPIANVSKKIMDYLESGRKNFVDIFVEVNHISNRQQTEEALEFLSLTGQIVTDIEKDKDTDGQVIYYRLKRNV